ncbi:MAG: sporulation protein YabP [Bacilli bacterium]|nr:sporulation protein YabP [Bacilli bacterium]
MENSLVGSHEIKINDRKSISLSGIKKIVSFNLEEFIMESNLGVLELKGHDLELIKLDTNLGNVAIKGTINNLNYLNKDKVREESIFAKLFK